MASRHGKLMLRQRNGGSGGRVRARRQEFCNIPAHGVLAPQDELLSPDLSESRVLQGRRSQSARSRRQIAALLLATGAIYAAVRALPSTRAAPFRRAFPSRFVPALPRHPQVVGVPRSGARITGVRGGPVGAGGRVVPSAAFRATSGGRRKRLKRFRQSMTAQRRSLSAVSLEEGF